MDVHENARTTPRSRMLMVERLQMGWTINAIAAAVGVDGRTVRKWRDRFQAEGIDGLRPVEIQDSTSCLIVIQAVDGTIRTD